MNQQRAPGGPEQECRRLLDEACFGALLAEVNALPGTVDRDAVFGVVCHRTYWLRGLDVLEPTAKAKVDKAFDDLRQCIDQLRAAIRESPWEKLTGADAVEIWTGGLEREYERLTGPGPWATSMKKLGFTSPKGGRPRSGIGQHVSALQGLGVPRLAAEGILDAAGLASR